jgi:recombination protein RecR
VLGGIISPINGIGPSDLTIRELVRRVEERAGDVPADMTTNVADISTDQLEIILALSGDVEGETTSFYIYRQLSKYNVKVTSLARGLGFGDDLEYADSLTLGRSIAGRQPFRP